MDNRQEIKNFKKEEKTRKETKLDKKDFPSYLIKCFLKKLML